MVTPHLDFALSSPQSVLGVGGGNPSFNNWVIPVLLAESPSF